MFRPFRTLLVFTVLLAAVVVPATAHASPLVWESIDLVLQEEGSPLMIVSGTVASDAGLPAQAMLPGPSGAELQWAGEVLGGPLDQDPSFTPSIESSGAQQIYGFTVNKGPMAQLELVVANAVVETVESRTATIRWQAIQDVSVVRAMIRLPQAAQVTTGTPDSAIVSGPAGYVYYQREFAGVRAGDTVTLTVTYDSPAGAVASTSMGEQAATPESSDALLPMLLVAGCVGVGLVVAVGLRGKAKADSEPVDDHETPDTPEMALALAMGDEGSAVETVSRTRPPRGLITAAFVTVFLVFVFFAVEYGTRPQVGNGVISTQITQIEQCTSSTYALAAPQDASLEKIADELFDALRMTEGIGLVQVYTDDPRIEVGYCESINTEAAIGEILSATGYLIGP